MDANIITIASKLKLLSFLLSSFISFGAQAEKIPLASGSENSINNFGYRSVPQVVPERSLLVYYYSSDN
ncbi:hypothetical protein EIO60_00267|nr:hypothetical protein [Candidatus Pantoea persica]